MNDIDYNAKKSIAKMEDKMEVERCVMEMVSWVSEQLNNLAFNDSILKTYNAAINTTRPA
jgi:hypothetical protein